MVALSRDAARQIARIARAFCRATSAAPRTYFSLERIVYKDLRTQKEFMQNRAACQASFVPDELLLQIADGYAMTGSRAISTLMNCALE